jgi:hypothetical protein
MPFRCFAVCHTLCIASLLHSGSSCVFSFASCMHSAFPLRPYHACPSLHRAWQHYLYTLPCFLLHILFDLCCMQAWKRRSYIHTLNPKKILPLPLVVMLAVRAKGCVTGFATQTHAHASMHTQNPSLRLPSQFLLSGAPILWQLAASFLPLRSSHSAFNRRVVFA